MRNFIYMAGILLVAVGAAAEPQVRASVDQTSVVVNRPFVVHIEATGSKITPPQFPVIDGLRVTRMAQQSLFKNIDMINGRMTMISSQGFGFVVQATRAGQMTIPPIPVQVDGKTLKTDPIPITVLDAGAQQRSPTPDDAVRIKAAVDKRDVYQGEPVMLTLSLMALQAQGLRVSPAARDFQPPSSEGFYAAVLEPTKTQIQDEFPYEVTEFHEVLYPTTPGDLRIGAWHWEGIATYGSGLFDQRQWQVTPPDTQPINITVHPLPDRPPNFSGAVGSFTIKALPARTDTVQGVPVKLQIQVSGRGNPDAIGNPQISKVENVYISDPEKESKLVKSPGSFGMEKTFTYNVTPLQPGDLTIPEVQFCYFDPASKSYKTEKTAPVVLHVQASAEPKAHYVVTPPSQSKVEVLGEDILPLITAPGRLRAVHGAGVGGPAVIVLPPAFYLGLALYMRRKRRFASDTGYARDYFAKSKSHKRLKNVLSSAEPTEELYRSLTGFIADKLNVNAEGMTSSDARQLLENRHVEPELTDNLVKILRACERTRYASAKISDDEAGALTQAAGIAIDSLDSALKGAGASRKEPRA